MKNQKIKKNEILNDIEASYLASISGKPEGHCFISYPDGQRITGMIKRKLTTREGVIPTEVEFACCVSEAILAPTTIAKVKLLKKAASLGLSVTGVTAILSALGIALGWGNGVVAIVIAFFASTPVFWPIALGVAGASALVVAGYLAVYDNPQTRSEKFLKSLHRTIPAAIDAYNNSESSEEEHAIAQPVS